MLGAEENLATLTRLVERFEAGVEEPLYLDQEWGAQIAKGTVGLRIPVERFVCKRKLSQDKDDVSRRQAIAKLREPGPYMNPGWRRRWSASGTANARRRSEGERRARDRRHRRTRAQALRGDSRRGARRASSSTARSRACWH